MKPRHPKFDTYDMNKVIVSSKLDTHSNQTEKWRSRKQTKGEKKCVCVCVFVQ
jgi:hypothetical protein